MKKLKALTKYLIPALLVGVMFGIKVKEKNKVINQLTDEVRKMSVKVDGQREDLIKYSKKYQDLYARLKMCQLDAN